MAVGTDESTAKSFNVHRLVSVDQPCVYWNNAPLWAKEQQESLAGVSSSVLEGHDRAGVSGHSNSARLDPAKYKDKDREARERRDVRMVACGDASSEYHSLI